MSEKAIALLNEMNRLLQSEKNWCRGGPAFDSNGRRVDALHEDAVAFCLHTALERAMSNLNDFSLRTALVVRSAIIKHTGGYWLMSGYNDAPSITFADVKQVIASAIRDLTPATRIRLTDVAMRSV